MEWKWTPIEKQQLESILRDETKALRTELAVLFQRYSVDLFEQLCLRDEASAVERVFVVAKKGDRLLYYDDVEEDFGVAIADADGVLRTWGNYPALASAIIALDEPSSVGL